MSLSSRSSTLVVALSVITLTRPAAAYCRATVEAAFAEAGDDCNDGPELAWTEPCLPIGVNFESFERRGVERTRARKALHRAMDAWTSADCGGGERPSFAFNYRGEMSCDRVEYVEDAERTNNNIVFFATRPLPEHATGLSTITFRNDDGEILDVDIELAGEGLGADGGTQLDLETSMLHELGHFLGLADSNDEDAVMYARVIHGPARHALSADDEAGICEIFPPGQEFSCPEEQAGRDFTRECAAPVELEGCSIGGSRAGSLAVWIALFGSLWTAAWRRGNRRSTVGS